jgi:ABC-type dipeptide/oligopeptide/nickel transport system ATPase component
VNGVDILLAEGEVMGLLGESGSGKDVARTSTPTFFDFREPDDPALAVLRRCRSPSLHTAK